MIRKKSLTIFLFVITLIDVINCFVNSNTEIHFNLYKNLELFLQFYGLFYNRKT